MDRLLGVHGLVCQSNTLRDKSHIPLNDQHRLEYCMILNSESKGLVEHMSIALQVR